MDIDISVEALSALAGLDEFGEEARANLVRALNKGADRTRTAIGRRVRDQIAYPASYLGPSQGRLVVAQRAYGEDFQVIVRGQDRPTSLARFTRQKYAPPARRGQRGRKRQAGVVVTVKPGRSKRLARAFLVPLKRGTAATGNLGLAVRTSGGPPKGAYKPKHLGGNAYLLYGPSVDQALWSAWTGKGVYEELADDALALVEREFLRLMKVGV